MVQDKRFLIKKFLDKTIFFFTYLERAEKKSCDLNYPKIMTRNISYAKMFISKSYGSAQVNTRSLITDNYLKDNAKSVSASLTFIFIITILNLYYKEEGKFNFFPSE